MTPNAEMVRQLYKIEGMQMKLFYIDHNQIPLDELSDELITKFYERSVKLIHNKYANKDTIELNEELLIVLTDIKNYNRYKKIMSIKNRIKYVKTD